MLESEYTVVSNINRHGIAPVEAAAHIVDLIERILKTGESGALITDKQTHPKRKATHAKSEFQLSFVPIFKFSQLICGIGIHRTLISCNI